jgi:hypothetical protein
MMRRNPEIAPRHVLPQRAGPGADRQDILAAEHEVPGKPAPADPFDRLRQPDLVIT